MPLGWQHRFTMTIEDQPTLRLLHGFAQSRACWGPVEGLLATGRVIEALDLPGHGAGGPAADGWTTADRLGSAPATDWLGYSLGGRMLLHLLLVVILMIVFPFSKLLHAPGLFFSPSRNQVDNPREQRHLAPWAKRFEQ